MAGAEIPHKERKRDRLKRVVWRAVPVPLSVRTSDLPKRAASAVVMLAIAGAALWLGGWWQDALFILVSVVCFGEFWRLVTRAARLTSTRIIAIIAGALYLGYSAWLLLKIDNFQLLLLVIGAVVCVDTFAYFFGRTLGGPKIAPRISPSKTWAGLLGGAVGATFALSAYFALGGGTMRLGNILELILPGALIAIVAQAGDFFESWLKRKAGMKDSSGLIPGHGGVFDRIDGLIPVVILVGTVLVMHYPHWLERQ